MLLLRAVSLLSLLVSGSFASRTSQAVGTGWQGGQGSVPRQQPADRNVSCARRPLTRPAVADVEVLAFDPPVKRSDWLQMDWVSITTLALFGPWPPPDDLYCHAHAHNVKIVKCVDFDAAGIANASARTAWVAQIVAEAVQLGTDGANVDIEGFGGQKDDLTSLISELSSEFKRRIPTARSLLIPLCFRLTSRPTITSTWRSTSTSSFRWHTTSSLRLIRCVHVRDVP